MTTRFSTTFMGHQGWMFRTDSTCVLVDTLLTERIGHGQCVGTLYPPRQIDLSSFPPVNAVIFSHEHEDHFDIPSIHRLDRRIPILLPGHSSSAARQLLSDLGFSYTLIFGGEKVSIGDLDFHFLSPDFVGNKQGDEWDVLQFVVSDRDGHGNFYTTVDTVPTRINELLYRRIVSQPGLYCYTNNCKNFSFLTSENPQTTLQPTFESFELAADIMASNLVLRREWRAPACTLIAGSGYAFEDAALNRRVFNVDSERIAAALSALDPSQMFSAPLPGQTFHMTRGKVKVDSSTSFLRTAPQPWVSRQFDPSAGALTSYGPFSGRHSLEPGELEELVLASQDLARYLYARDEFKALLSLSESDRQGRRATFVMCLLSAGSEPPITLEYQPHACCFQVVEVSDPSRTFAAGLECWATDLLGMFRGEIAPAAVVFGRGRSWNHCDKWLYFGLYLFFGYFHPLRRPDKYLALYRKMAAMESPNVSLVPASSRGNRA